MRDSLGRQSLLIGKCEHSLIISSVADKLFDECSFIELPPLGVFKFSFDTEEISLFPWKNIDSHEVYIEQLNTMKTFISNSIIVVEKSLQPHWTQDTKTKDDVRFYIFSIFQMY